MGILKPPKKYVHPRKHRYGTEKTDATALPPISEKVSSDKIVGTQEDKPTDKAQYQKNDNPKTELFRLVIYPPVGGVVPVYDQMLEAGINPRQALLGLLKKGFTQFEADLLNGKIEITIDHWETDGQPIDTTRNVEPDFIVNARKVYDPYGIISDRALGRIVAEAAIRSASNLSTTQKG